MSSDILVRDQIFSTYDSLYDAEKKVADYLISHPSEAIEMSVSELASHCDASQATIIRFCKKIGCKGFHQLKIKLAGEQRQQEEQVISNEIDIDPVSYTHLRAHETRGISYAVFCLKKKK